MDFLIHKIRFDCIDSTHRWTKKNAEELDLDAVTCISADEQTQGTGQRGRNWISPPGCNIYLTLYFTLPKESGFLSNLGQLLSLSTAAVLRKKGCAVQIKWPNDLLIEKKKVAGVLCEVLLQETRVAIILSLGLNVNMDEKQLALVDQAASSLALLTKQHWDRDLLEDEIVREFLRNLPLLQTRGFAPFHEKYEELLAFKEETICCQEGFKRIEGICHGILPDGRLILLLPSGEKKFLSSAAS
jgi:BirA family transcriptional regulator, biotin operon repressor / biotin---[acetyl-CoA-carboxylase] ligase